VDHATAPKTKTVPRMRLRETQLCDTLCAVQDFGAPSREDGVSFLAPCSCFASNLLRRPGLRVVSVARARKRSSQSAERSPFLCCLLGNLVIASKILPAQSR